MKTNRSLKKDYADDYNPEVQKLLMSVLVADPDMFAKCRTIMRDEYFDDEFRPMVRFVVEHADNYRSVPTVEMIHAKTGVSLAAMERDTVAQHKQWFCESFEGFCRYRAMENAILDGVDMLREGRGEELSQRVRDALTIRLMSDLGTDYFADPEARLRLMLENTTTVSTGLKLLDDQLYGGFQRGGLNMFLGLPGSGKSLVLQNLALNWALAGYDGIYFSLELAETHTSLKIDAMLTGRGTRDVVGDMASSALLIKTRSKKAGRLHIKKYPESGTSCNDFLAYIKEYEISKGKKPDFIMIDYLDLVFPNDKRIDPSNLFIKDKFVSEEIRALMHETNCFGATASQINRSGQEVMGEFDQSHIAGGISKINTADNVIALYAPPSHKERGEFDMVFLKTRSSSGVGHRIKLSYDPTCMRISDPVLKAADVDRGASYVDLKAEVAAKLEPSQEAQPAATNDRLDRLSAMMAKKRA